MEEGCFGVGQAPSRVATPMARQQAPFAQYDISDAVPPAPVATPPVATPSYGAERMAHEDSMAGARVARARNAGSFAFGDDPAPQQRARPAPLDLAAAVRATIMAGGDQASRSIFMGAALAAAGAAVPRGWAQRAKQLRGSMALAQVIVPPDVGAELQA